MIHPSEVEVIQREVAESFGEKVGIRDGKGLEEVLARPFATRNGIPVYPTFLNRVAVLLQGLVQMAPFHGANRRTSLCVAVLVLQEKGYRLRADAEQVKTLFHGVELGFTTWHRVTVWIKGHTLRERRR